MRVSLKHAAVAVAGTIPTGASAASFLYTTSTNLSNSLGRTDEYTFQDQNGAYPANGGGATSLVMNSRAYQSYYTTNSSGWRYYYDDVTTVEYRGNVVGGDAFGRALIGFAPGGYDNYGGTASFSHSINGGTPGSLNPFGNPYTLPVANGMPVVFNSSAHDYTYNVGTGATINATIGVADAPGITIQQFVPQWTTVSGPVDPSVPLHIDGNLTLAARRDMVNVPGIGYMHSPYRDSVIATETIFLNGVAQGSYTWSALNWNPGESGILGLGGGAGFDIDLTGLPDGVATAELALLTTVVYKAYDYADIEVGSQTIQGSYVTQTLTVPEPTSLAFLGVGLLLLGKRRADAAA